MGSDTAGAVLRFGRLLADHRVRAGLTQEQVACLAQLSVRGLRNLELGLVPNPRRSTMAALAAALRLDAEQVGALDGHLRAARTRSRPTVPPAPQVTGTALPAPPTPGIGRHDAIRTLHTWLALEHRPAVLITGQAGTGKTTLAVRAAHELRAAFPDGQLYLDIGRGTTADGVLVRVLRQLGTATGDVPGDIPGDPDERLDRYRAVVGRRRLLIVADGASAAHVRLLRPGPGPAALIAVNQSVLPSCTDLPRVTLAPFDADEGVALLAAVIGPDRVAREARQARRIVAHCGGHPLAVHVAGTRLLVHTHRSLAWLADRLEDERHRLDELTVDDVAVRASLMAAVQALSAPARRLFGLLGQLPGGPAPAAALVAAGMDLAPADVEPLLDELVALHLLDVTAAQPPTGLTGSTVPIVPTGPRFVLRGLVRLLAAELGGSERRRRGDRLPPAPRHGAAEVRLRSAPATTRIGGVAAPTAA